VKDWACGCEEGKVSRADPGVRAGCCGRGLDVRTRRGERGPCSRLRSRVSSSERRRCDLGLGAAACGLWVRGPFPRDEGESLIPLFQGRVTCAPPLSCHSGRSQ
jgi:hypothetical protein